MKSILRKVAGLALSAALVFGMISCSSEAENNAALIGILMSSKGNSSGNISEGFVKVKGGTVTGKSNTNNYDGVFISGRTVTLSDFYMSKYEVTKAQYKAIMEDTRLNNLGITADPSYSTLKPKTYVMAAGEEDYERPIENVTWYDAVYFCNLLSQKEGLEPVYTISEPQTSTASISSAGASGTAGYGTHQKGLKAANALDIYDMSGNVWEWCYDWYSISVSTGEETDPLGSSSGSCRSLRGGSWFNDAYIVSVCYRYYSTPSNRGYNFVGIRLVRTAN